MNSTESKLIDWAWDDKIKLGIKSKHLHNYTESQVKKTMKKNILVTGGFGLLGKPLVQKLVKLNHNVIILEKKSTDRIKFLKTKHILECFISLESQ